MYDCLPRESAYVESGLQGGGLIERVNQYSGNSFLYDRYGRLINVLSRTAKRNAVFRSLLTETQHQDHVYSFKNPGQFTCYVN